MTDRRFSIGSRGREAASAQGHGDTNQKMPGSRSTGSHHRDQTSAGDCGACTDDATLRRHHAPRDEPNGNSTLNSDAARQDYVARIVAALQQFVDHFARFEC